MSADLWPRVCEELRIVIGQDAFSHWIDPLQFRGCEDGVARLAAPTPFIGNWVSQHYGERIQKLICKSGTPVVRLDFTVLDQRMARAPAVPANSEKPARYAGAAAQAPVATSIVRPADTELPGSPLDPKYKFDNFVVGKPNELAHAAARRVSEPGPVTFNPLFLYGGVGLGKTHLMHAIAWQIQETQPEARVLYLSAEQFMYRFVQALRFKDMHGFKQLFRSVDVLMVDDVQFIGGKDSTQEEFFHTFNALVDQGRQIVITSDRPPNEIQGIEDRIISRLQSGLVVDVHPTDYELRLGILQSKAEAQARLHPGIEVDHGIFEYLAMRISSNVRVLEGALTRLFAFASLVGRRIDMEMAQECLSDILRASERKVTIDEIIRKVAEHYNVRMADLLGPRRARSVSRPRQVAMFLSKNLTTKSLPEIGRRFGGRDHTTVIHAVKKVEELRTIDAQISDDVELLRRMLEA
ncbi:chromosomal replication initiator protein DnaA [Algicella marina]|uniref:Chromosomal replication initiator protein DnaA n=1 Tax=Algicella marina TaxID=2683284 RepID=A0A6P1T1M7_9RHOB|nr:chromosomal replication initiator protein DnaA [Algicella marina]QHQ36638.1 chromosomal replication initiator protein DnaA [Algicella marina]